MRTALSSCLPVLRILASTFMAWKLLSLATNTSHPAMVVLSGSMEPAFQRGDIIFLSNWTQQVEVGDIPVLWFEGNPLPMVHRAVEVHGTGRQLIMTKGDNSKLRDVALYPPGQIYVYRTQVVGVVRGYVPYLGWVTIAFREVPWLRELLIIGIGAIGMFQIMLGQEEKLTGKGGKKE
ncbi:signal peptidase, putative [Coccidioides posadasii C735 delta SOWgp]|uniref:Signal peptidase complex catalytic subunit SEC11 n=3 Tax=Coccidioides posadasii TaxID=199306 RepID=E9CV16_COCPS|nr:signal peptidase, putative [Coccidioides posadasii C735 delta SOWgp]EER24856.1 signal peptidase, putative [Coccidioides posadasii C735 delta SOWgp]EFW21207.1 signal peptidase complex catalytic subunit SEC11 [Coccidioides posadasii str. Silveira]KMM71613.1 signal peptidase complex catalytic subunit SEC11 [Coccidioides posadasii RMSCC 3488]|eukprot:XP_003067001.1 signal peptidase, putative [Coccidioides posadasii C735 delta SOWgp]